MLFRFFLVRLNYKKWSVRRKTANVYLLRPHLPPQNLFQTQHQSRRCCRYNTLGSCQPLTKDLDKFMFFQLQEMEKKGFDLLVQLMLTNLKLLIINSKQELSLSLHLFGNCVACVSFCPEADSESVLGSARQPPANLRRQNHNVQDGLRKCQGCRRVVQGTEIWPRPQGQQNTANPSAWGAFCRMLLMSSRWKTCRLVPAFVWHAYNGLITLIPQIPPYVWYFSDCNPLWAIVCNDRAMSYKSCLHRLSSPCWPLWKKVEQWTRQRSRLLSPLEHRELHHNRLPLNHRLPPLRPTPVLQISLQHQYLTSSLPAATKRTLPPPYRPPAIPHHPRRQ